MGYAVDHGGIITDPVFGRYQDIEGTFDSTIALWDGGWQDGDVPANGATVENLCRKRMSAVTGLALNQCDFSVVNDTGPLIGTERTENGGIHVASTQAGAQAAPAGFTFYSSQAFADWLLSQTDSGADYAVMHTLWARKTREYVTSGGPQATAWLTALSMATGNFFFHEQGGDGFPNNTWPGGAASNLGVSQALLALDVPGLICAASQGWHGTKPTTVSPAQFALLSAGARGAWAGLNYNKAASWIFYRMQLELVDLSEMPGANRAAKAAAMLAGMNDLRAREFAAGGRFHGDAFTPASTLKP